MQRQPGCEKGLVARAHKHKRRRQWMGGRTLYVAERMMIIFAARDDVAVRCELDCRLRPQLRKRLPKAEQKVGSAYARQGALLEPHAAQGQRQTATGHCSRSAV